MARISQHSNLQTLDIFGLLTIKAVSLYITFIYGHKIPIIPSRLTSTDCALAGENNQQKGDLTLCC